MSIIVITSVHQCFCNFCAGTKKFTTYTCVAGRRLKCQKRYLCRHLMSHNKTSHANWNQVVLTCSESIAMYNGGFWQKWNSQSCRSTFRVKKHDLLKWQPWIQTDTIDTQCYLHVYSLVQTGTVFVWQLRLGNGNQKYFTLTITPYLKQRLAILAEGPYTKKVLHTKRTSYAAGWVL